MSVSVEAPALVNRIEPSPESVRAVVVVHAPNVPPAISSRFALVVMAVVLLGGGLRVAAWLGDRNLWIDEAMLALNLVSRTPARLLEPLDWNQGAPVGFLLAVKGTIATFGPSERALRLVPLIGSILGLIGFAWLASKFLPRTAALLATILFGLSPVLLSYSAECKQYATDAAIAIGLLVAAAGPLQGLGGVRRWAILAFAGALAVWFSHPAAFVLGGIGASLFASAVWKRDRLRSLAAAATIAAWLVSFATCYLLFVRNLGGNSYLLDYWTGHFLPAPRSVGDLVWPIDHFFTAFAYPGGLGGSEVRAGGIAAALFLIGLRGLWKSRWELAVALVLPAALALAASALHLYPFAGRLLLFLVPGMILLTAFGAGILIDAVAKSQPFAAVVIVGILLAAPALQAIQEFRRPTRSEQIVPTLNELRTRLRPTDRVHVYYGALPAFEFYTRNDPLPTKRIDRGVESRTVPTAYRDRLRQFAGEPRVWIVFSHVHENEEAVIVAYAESLGRRRETIRNAGAAAFLFDFTKTEGERRDAIPPAE